MMIRSILPAILLLCLLTSPMAAEELTDLSTGAKVSNFVTMGQTQIPLPRGEWELKLAHTKRHQEYGKIGRAFLMQEMEESGFQGVEMISNIDSCAPLGWDKGICGRKNTHHNESKGAVNEKNAECWNVNHFTIDPNSKYAKGFWRKFRNELNDIRKTMFANRMTFLVNQYRWSDQCHFVTLWYFVNPKTFDFSSEASTWKDSAWHRDVVGEDPRRKALVAAVTDVGRELRDAVKSGFNGELNGQTFDIVMTRD